MTKKTITKQPTRREIICLVLAVRDSYLSFDQEDYCGQGMKRCGKCYGCIQYNNLKRAYKLAKKYLPKIDP